MKTIYYKGFLIERDINYPGDYYWKIRDTRYASLKKAKESINEFLGAIDTFIGK